MHSSSTIDIITAGVANRRQVLQGAASLGIGLLLGFNWAPRHARANVQAAETLNAFIQIAPDGTVTVLSKHLEMGQGVHTGLATIVAEELDADWTMMRVSAAPADAERYANSIIGIQVTGGSTSIANSYEQLRKAGATARAMLIGVAAQEWNVPISEITAENSVVKHARSGRSATFGALAPRAAGIAPPAAVSLKDPASFKLIGKDGPGIDTRAKSSGTAQYASDVVLPEMLTALVQRPPLFGARLKSFDARQARAVKGVVDVVAISSGVAVVARNFWAARTGREALIVDWDDSAAEKRGSDQILAEYRELAKTPGLPATKQGDVEAAFANAARVIEGSYDFPYLAHAPMEPLDCVVRLGPETAEIWSGNQFQTVDQANAARVLGLRPEQVQIHTVLAGGSFGRRATPTSDYIVEAVEIAKALGGRAPIKLIWTREDDIRGGRYRPLYHHALAAALDAQGEIIGWRHRIVGQSIAAGTPFAAAIVNGVDTLSTEGASNLPYSIPNMTVELHTTEVGVPILWWRSVGSSHTAFATEVFLDEIAAETKRDPLDLRRTLLREHSRHLGVLNLAAEKANWSLPLPEGRARGIAVHACFGSFVAHVAEISLGGDEWKVEQVTVAVDCGRVINPRIVRAQMEGSVAYGLSAALKPGIRLVDGAVEQSNFHDYDVLRLSEMPAVDVHIVPSVEAPTGVGEPGVPPTAPAVANALMAATRQRFRALPLPSAISNNREAAPP